MSEQLPSEPLNIQDGFMELPKEPFFGADIHVKNLSQSEFKVILANAAFVEDKPIFGYFNPDSDGSGGFTYHITRYPRTKRYDIPSLGKMNENNQRNSVFIRSEKCGYRN